MFESRKIELRAIFRQFRPKAVDRVSSSHAQGVNARDRVVRLSSKEKIATLAQGGHPSLEAPSRDGSAGQKRRTR